MVKSKKPFTAERAKLILPKVKNKIRKTALMLRLKFEMKKLQKKEKDKRKKTRAKTGEAPQMPKTIESMRVPDETIVTSDNEEVKKDEEIDEFSKYFNEDSPPKVLLTTCKRPSEKLESFTQEIQTVIPNSEYYTRRNYTIQEIVKYSTNKDYTDVLIFSQRNKKPDSLVFIHLPEGPTAHFRVTSVKQRKELYWRGNPTKYYPELILKNFDTRLGQRLGRMFTAIFPQNPEFRGRNVVTFKNQRDFIFFRRHRYMFKEEGSNVKLQEVGPRFTLKLLSLQEGAFEGDSAQYEFMYHPKMQVNRKKFYI